MSPATEGVNVPRRFEERNVPPRLQGLVSRVLRSGVLIAAILLSLGIALGAGTVHGSLLAYPAPSNGSGFVEVAAAAGAPLLILLGLLVLTVTPLTRVGISVALFSAARDRPFALITLFVLAILAITVVVGVLH